MTMMEKDRVRTRPERDSRWKLFLAIDAARAPQRVLYPACQYDVSPSLVFPDVTYVDDRPDVAAFFGDIEGVLDLVAECSTAPEDAVFRYIRSGSTKLTLPRARFDLVISFDDRPVAASCARHLKIGGWFLTQGGSQDAIMLAQDPSFALAGIVTPMPGEYRLQMIDRGTAPPRANRSEITPDVRAQERQDPVPDATSLVFERVA